MLRKIILGLSLVVASSAASASLIGVFGDYNSSKTALTSSLTNLGHTVTQLGTDVNQDLSSFDSVWGVSAFNTISGSEQSYLSSYLASGGGLYLTGERPCCDQLNASLTTFVNSVVTAGGIQVGSLGDHGSSSTINTSAVGGIATSPNTVTSWFPSASGGITGVSGDNILATSNSTGGIVAAIWDMEDLLNESGRIALMMDVNWLAGGQLGLLENIEVFLANAAQGSGNNGNVPEPASMVLFGIGLLGFGFARKKVS